tara:strand:+ start:1874 stop:1978 length:105 start_codon:yes stop_codon:yes gene_type:complete
MINVPFLPKEMPFMMMLKQALVVVIIAYKQENRQ